MRPASPCFYSWEYFAMAKWLLFTTVSSCVLLAGVGSRGIPGLEPHQPQQAPVRLVDLPLARATWAAVSFAVGNTLTCQVPATAAFALTRINADALNLNLQVSVNGVPVSGIVFGGGSSVHPVLAFDPPVLLRPGDIFSVATNPVLGNPGAPGVLYFGGWNVQPGEI
jgi:hypothetical protein